MKPQSAKAHPQCNCVEHCDEAVLPITPVSSPGKPSPITPASSPGMAGLQQPRTESMNIPAAPGRLSEDLMLSPRRCTLCTPELGSGLNSVQA